MRCRNPFNPGGGRLFPCGRCPPCLINRRRVWANRISLEQTQHGSSTFLTLTYDDNNMPRTTSGLSTLEPADLTRWLKRIRKAVAPIKLRYFMCGEYGDESFRPHYHAALFGMATCTHGQTLRSRNRPIANRCCATCRLIQSTWSFGDIDSRSLEEGRAEYVAGYVTKKMTRGDDPRLDGRYQEFARMSLKPGLGKDAMWEVASVIMQYDIEVSEPDVPTALQVGKKLWPLGRYLRQQLRLMVGKEINASDEALQLLADKLRPMREAAYRSQTDPSFKSHVVKAFSQEALNLTTRSLIFRKRGTL